jgi:hypothetical protein
MRPKTPPFRPLETKEERENTIKAFIRDGLDGSTRGETGGEHAIALLARSPASPVVAALLELSDELAHRGIGAAIVLAGGATAAEDETWSLSFSAKFIHEIRLTSNPRVLDGHEQLIVGDRSVWYGDCMRRDPLKRDAFTTFLANDTRSVRACRFAFRELWRGAQSIYRNGALTSLVVTAQSGGSVETLAPVTAVPAENRLEQVGEGGVSITETLAAWQPSTRH